MELRRGWPVGVIALLVPFAFNSFVTLDTRYSTKVGGKAAKGLIDLPAVASPLKQCTIYMAPSSINGHSGFGLYTTRDIRQDSAVLRGPDGVSIPIFDFNLGPKSKIRHQWIYEFGEYWWGRGVPDHARYEADRIFDYQVGFGSLPNHHCILQSLNPVYPDSGIENRGLPPRPPYDDTILSRFKDPGAGAITYDMGRVFQATRDVKANEELFMDYGYCERQESDSEDWTSVISMPEDYEKAAKIVWDFWKLSVDPKAKIPVPLDTNKHVVPLVPETMEELQTFMSTANSEEDVIPLLARYVTSTPRSTDWIRSNGLCLENLLPSRSQLRQAGQGAFAQFRLGAGEVIVPAPVLHIVDKDALNEYDQDKNRIGTQLLMNYCLGHPESSILLCPNSNAVLVNHCSMRKKECGQSGPNAKYRWSSGWDPASDIWRNKSIDELGKEHSRVLAMEIVALRDIECGEEVFVDYGIEWEQAWDKHLSRWNPPRFKEDWITAKEANDNKTSILGALVSGDLRSTTDHPYLFTGCQYRTGKPDRHQAYGKSDLAWYQLDDDEILSRFADDGSMYSRAELYSFHNDKSYWPCSVLRQDGYGTFTIRIHQSQWHPRQNWDKNDKPRILTNYPRDSIHFFVKPYESDQHLPTAFRHPVGIPNDIFPNHWKNRRATIL